MVAQLAEQYMFSVTFFDATTGLPRVDLTVNITLYNPSGASIATGSASVVDNRYIYTPAANVLNAAGEWNCVFVPTVTTNVNPPEWNCCTYVGQVWIQDLDTNVGSRTKPADTQAAVTNLTNAPTAGDFTPTMKSSLNAATPASVTTVTGNVNGNVGGNVTGSVGSVLGNVAGSVASVVGNVGGNVVGTIGSLAAQAKTDVAAAVLNAVAASYNVAGSIGALINLISSINVSGIAASVWNYLLTSLGDTTTIGGYVYAQLAVIVSRITTGTYNIIDGFSANGQTLHLTQWATHAANFNPIVLTVSVPVALDNTCTILWTLKINNTPTKIAGYFVSYDSGAGTVTVGLPIASAQAGLLTNTGEANFTLNITDGTSGILVPIYYQIGKLIVYEAAPPS